MQVSVNILLVFNLMAISNNYRKLGKRLGIALRGLFAASFAFVACNALAHGGGLDRRCGHNDRVRGGYHYHLDICTSVTTDAIPLELEKPTDLARSIQTNLAAMNYYKGDIDGLAGGELVGSILEYQFANGLEITVVVSDELLRRMERSLSEGQQYLSPSEKHRLESQIFNPPEIELVKKTQSLLNSLGYKCGSENGEVGGQTVSAVLDYQFDHKLELSGKITYELLEHLQRLDRVTR